MVLTFQGLADGIDSIGERIEDLNLDRQEPVAVSITNRLFMLTTVFALLRNGYSVAPVSARRHPFLASAGIRNMIYDREGLVISQGRNIRFDPSWLPKPQPGLSRTYRARPATDSNLIFFTSGTTGLPKKVIQTADVIEERLTSPDACGTGAYRKVLILTSPATAFGFNFACEVLNVGKTVCFSLPGRALSLINLFGIEVIVAAPAQALLLAETKKQNSGYRVDSLKAIFIGGGKIDSGGIRRIRTALCRNVINYYGSTEAGACIRSPFDRIGDAPGGIPLPGVEAEIVDDTDRQVPVGVEGLVRLRTPQLAATLKAVGSEKLSGVRDGWFYPGDLGSLDNDGTLHVLGRSSDVINRSGFKVSGRRIEEILQALPEIEEAAACGIIGKTGVEELWIGVVPKGAIDVERIKILLSEHNDVQICPDEIIVMDELPRGELGKVQRPLLKDLMLNMKKGG